MANTQTNVQYVDCLAIARNLQGTRYPRIQFHAVDDVETARIINGYDNQGVPVLDFITNKTRKLRLTNEGVSLLKGANVSEFSIDGTLSDNSDNAVPTEKAVKTYVDTKVSDILIGNVTANTVSYDNSISGLLSTNVQSVVDEINSKAVTWIGPWVAGTYPENTMSLDDDCIFISNVNTSNQPAVQYNGDVEKIYEDDAVLPVVDTAYEVIITTKYKVLSYGTISNIRQYIHDKVSIAYTDARVKSIYPIDYLEYGWLNFGELITGWNDLNTSTDILLYPNDIIEFTTSMYGDTAREQLINNWIYSGQYTSDSADPDIGDFIVHTDNTTLKFNIIDADGVDNSATLLSLTKYDSISYYSDVTDQSGITIMSQQYRVTNQATLNGNICTINVKYIDEWSRGDINDFIGETLNVNTRHNTEIYELDYASIPNYIDTVQLDWATIESSTIQINLDDPIDTTNGYGQDIWFQPTTSPLDWTRIEGTPTIRVRR